MSSLINNDTKQSRPYQYLFVQCTESTNLQQATELECQPFFVTLSSLPALQLEHLRETGLVNDKNEICLLRDKHKAYLSLALSSVDPLPSHFGSLDASQPWMMYWTLHALDLLDQRPPQKQAEAIVQTLKKCFARQQVTIVKERIIQDKLLSQLTAINSTMNATDSTSIHATTTNSTSTSTITLSAGGFGGGPGQMPHAATTYAAVLSLCSLLSSTPLAFDLLQSIRLELYAWLASLQLLDGSFCMNHDQEVDVRATYCVLACLQLLGLHSNQSSIDSVKAADYLQTCQTWEGGFAAEPWREAHGGYTYCAVAACYMLRAFDKLNVPALTGWLARRQMSFEGGFQGRSNKLVDGCYSFWQGSALAIVSMYQTNENNDSIHEDPWLDDDNDNDKAITTPILFDQAMLERYVLLCAQDVAGGLRDKPSKSRDFYHSCYNLSGLSVAQHSHATAERFGDPVTTVVAKTHPVYNIRIERVRDAFLAFSNLDND
jgi:protein farnesyltransferase subunit beta